jgi:hypothetical protein
MHQPAQTKGASKNYFRDETERKNEGQEQNVKNPEALFASNGL